MMMMVLNVVTVTVRLYGEAGIFHVIFAFHAKNDKALCLSPGIAFACMLVINFVTVYIVSSRLSSQVCPLCQE